MLVRKVLRSAWSPPQPRALSTLASNPSIHVFPDDQSINHYILSCLTTSPPKRELAVGQSTEIPPTPASFVENRRFLNIVQSVLAEYAHEDQDVKSQAQAMASNAGSTLGSGGALFRNQSQGRRKSSFPGNDGAGGASSQGGAGGAGRGGYIHVFDSRRPPDFGRIPEPEDIFGSLEVDGEGNFVNGHGNYQESGTYRLVTNHGILGLTPFLKGKVVARLKIEETALQ